MARVEFDLGRMDAEAQQVWMGVYQLGYRDGVNRGVQIGRDEAEAAETAAWEAFGALVRRAAVTPDLDELAERRGQPARAVAVRRLWMDRGIA